MSRSNYSEDCGNWQYVRWRGAVKSAIKGKRGQAFLKEMLEALDGMPEKRLIAHELIDPEGEVCAIGCIVKSRQLEGNIDIYDHRKIAFCLGIADALVREIEYINDSCCFYGNTLPEKRFEVVRGWVVSQIKKEGVSA